MATIPDAAIPSGAAYLLDKPRGITSRRASASVARAWGFRKFGHAGTLDPDATGLLIVLLGRATRLSRFIVTGSKSYSFGVRLGVVTDTDDLTGRILQSSEVPSISMDQIHEVLGSLTGEIDQKVPVFSAVRVNGERSYKSARKGMAPDTPVRRVSVSGWTVHSIDGSDLRLSVTVSAGTYVRALARDMGVILGTGGAAFDIRRTSVGPFDAEESSETPDSRSALIDMASLMRGTPTVIIDQLDADEILTGRPVSSSETGTVSILSEDGTLLAVGQGDGLSVQPVCVLGNG